MLSKMGSPIDVNELVTGLRNQGWVLADVSVVVVIMCFELVAIAMGILSIKISDWT